MWFRRGGRGVVVVAARVPATIGPRATTGTIQTAVTDDVHPIVRSDRSTMGTTEPSGDDGRGRESWPSRMNGQQRRRCRHAWPCQAQTRSQCNRRSTKISSQVMIAQPPRHLNLPSPNHSHRHPRRARHGPPLLRSQRPLCPRPPPSLRPRCLCRRMKTSSTQASDKKPGGSLRSGLARGCNETKTAGFGPLPTRRRWCRSRCWCHRWPSTAPQKPACFVRFGRCGRTARGGSRTRTPCGTGS